MDKIQVKLLRADAHMPTYGSEYAAGADLYACLSEGISVASGETVWIPTGIAVQIPVGHAGLIFARSSMGTKRDLAPANKVGVIDSDYRGEIRVGLINLGNSDYTIEPGERIAQMVFAPVLRAQLVESESLEDTERGAGGFGSTGR